MMRNKKLKPPAIKKKYAFTLLEVVISIAIFALAATVFVIPFRDLVQRKLFQKECMLIHRQFLTCQALALSRASEIAIHLYKSANNYYLEITSDEPHLLPRGFTRFELKTIKQIKNQQNAPLDQIHLMMDSAGRLLPASLLRIESHSFTAHRVELDFKEPLGIHLREPLDN